MVSHGGIPSSITKYANFIDDRSYRGEVSHYQDYYRVNDSPDYLLEIYFYRLVSSYEALRYPYFFFLEIRNSSPLSSARPSATPSIIPIDFNSAEKTPGTPEYPRNRV